MQGLNYKGVIDQIQAELEERRAVKLRRTAYLALARVIVHGELSLQSFEYGRELPAPPASSRAA